MAISSSSARMERNDKKEPYRTNRIIFYTEKKFLRYDRAILPIVVFFCFLVGACELAAGGVVRTGEEVVPEEVVRAVELLAVVKAGLRVLPRADVGDDAAVGAFLIAWFVFPAAAESDRKKSSRQSRMIIVMSQRY